VIVKVKEGVEEWGDGEMSRECSVSFPKTKETRHCEPQNPMKKGLADKK